MLVHRLLVQVRAEAKKAGISETQDALYGFLLERVRTNLHVVLCLSPIGDGFRTRCRMFPGLVNCTTIDWFTPWPSDALFEVAAKLLESADVGSDDTRKAVCQVRDLSNVRCSTSSRVTRLACSWFLGSRLRTKMEISGCVLCRDDITFFITSHSAAAPLCRCL